MSTPIQRQFVSFIAYQLDPAFRRLDADAKQSAKREFTEVAETPIDGLILNAYSTVGLKLQSDLMFWRIGKTGSDPIQAHAAALNKTQLGGYLSQTHSFLSMTKRSQYIDKVDPFHTEESRTNLIPGKRRYIFVYPFVKTREWYLAGKDVRQSVMDEHIKVGNKYPSVKLNTTYSFGLDDQDFVVAFESDEPKDFLDLVQELRETQGSLYTVRDTPIITGVRMGVGEILEQMG